jgi:hypothetical protein
MVSHSSFAKVILLADAMLSCGCAAAPTRADRAVRHIDTMLNAFYDAHPTRPYPRSLSELSAFAASRGQPLDLAAFKTISLEHSKKSVDITYEVGTSLGVVHHSHLH